MIWTMKWTTVTFICTSFLSSPSKNIWALLKLQGPTDCCLIYNFCNKVAQYNTCICTTPRSTSCWITNIWSLIYDFYNKLTNLFTTYTTLKTVVWWQIFELLQRDSACRNCKDQLICCNCLPTAAAVAALWEQIVPGIRPVLHSKHLLQSHCKNATLL